MNSAIKHGTVKFFLRRENYGFIIPDEGGRDVCFRLESGRAAYIGNGTLGFFRGVGSIPRGSDRVVYTINQTSLTLASFWCFEYQYREAQTELDAQPDYRIMKQHTFRNELGGPRKPSCVLANTKLQAMLNLLAAGKVPFVPVSPERSGMTTTMWVEVREGSLWVRNPGMDKIAFEAVSKANTARSSAAA